MAVEVVDVAKWTCEICEAVYLSEGGNNGDIPHGWSRVTIEDLSGGRSYIFCSTPCTVEGVKKWTTANRKRQS